MKDNSEWEKLRGCKSYTLLKKFQITKPPVPILEIISGLGVAYQTTNNKPDWSGALDNRCKPPVIWIRSTDLEAHQRFAAAHELAHLLLHEQNVLWRDVTFLGNKKETQANNWAAKLLVPENLILMLLAENKDITIGELAEAFIVSPSTIEYRLRQLGFIN